MRRRFVQIAVRNFSTTIAIIAASRTHHAEELTFRHFVLHATHELSNVDTKVFATLRYGQGRVATFFKAIVAYAVTQLLIGLMFILVLVTAVVRAALAK